MCHLDPVQPKMANGTDISDTSYAIVNMQGPTCALADGLR
jgi:hypothetical protein